MYIIGKTLSYICDILYWAIVIKSILTWFPNRVGNLYNMLAVITEPIEGPIRSIMYKYTNGPVDFSPMIAIIILMFLQRVALMIAYM